MARDRERYIVVLYIGVDFLSREERGNYGNGKNELHE